VIFCDHFFIVFTNYECFVLNGLFWLIDIHLTAELAKKRKRGRGSGRGRGRTYAALRWGN